MIIIMNLQIVAILIKFSTLLYYISQVIWVSKYRWSTSKSKYQYQRDQLVGQSTKTTLATTRYPIAQRGRSFPGLPFSSPGSSSQATSATTFKWWPSLIFHLCSNVAGEAKICWSCYFPISTFSSLFDTDVWWLQRVTFAFTIHNISSKKENYRFFLKFFHFFKI